MYTLHLYVPRQYSNVYHDHIDRWLSRQNERGDEFDAGFDLLLLSPLRGSRTSTLTVDHKVSARMVDHQQNPCCYYLYPRSSLSRTRFRLANSVGIIDSGYTGNLKAKVDMLPYETLPQTLEANKCYFQICAPDLGRIQYVHLHLNEDAEGLGETSRGAGGFGSTS